jgi:hypothetical protein
LIEFGEYPAELKNDLFGIVILLVDIYDLVIKFDSNQLDCEENILEKIEAEESKAFYQYLMDVEKSSEKDLIAVMEAKGLILK